MNQLKVIEKDGQRVLFTSQLAESYGASNRRISENFNRNRERFIEGKHFIALEGNEKHYFLNRTQIADGSKNAQILYLWTEKGAFLHAKSLNTDAAWSVYEKLVDSYFSKVKVLSEQEQLIASMKMSIKTAEEVSTMKNDIQFIKQQVNDELTLNHGQQTALHHQIKIRVESIKEDYELTIRELYSQLHSHLRRAFLAPKYIFVRRKDFDDAMAWVKAWRPLI